MRTPPLGSVMLGSTDPTRLRDWYASTFDITPDPHGGWLEFGGVGLLIDGRDDVAPRTAEPGRVLFNLHVDDPRAVAAALDEAGVTWVAPLEDRGYGWFGTIADPDGNLVQIVRVLGPDPSPLAGSVPFGGFTVSDVDAARDFYTGALGLAVSDLDMPGMFSLDLEGGRRVLVYGKDDHEPAGYTVLNFPVPDVAATVQALADRGVEFQRYDGFDQDELGVHRGGGPLIAWFTDPSGNVMSVIDA